MVTAVGILVCEVGHIHRDTSVNVDSKSQGTLYCIKIIKAMLKVISPLVKMYFNKQVCSLIVSDFLILIILRMIISMMSII